MNCSICGDRYTQYHNNEVMEFNENQCDDCTVKASRLARTIEKNLDTKGFYNKKGLDLDLEELGYSSVYDMPDHWPYQWAVEALSV